MKDARFQRPPSAYPTEVAISAGETRVLDLLPGSLHDGICCRLMVHSLVDTAKSTSYDALSYVWGPFYPEPGTSIAGVDGYPQIQVNGVGKFPVSINLWYALRRLRRRSESIRLWVDQICINQQCRQERKEQVVRIGDIFHQARRVYLWFGEVHGDNMLSQKDAFKKMIRPDGHVDPWWTRSWVLKEFAYAKDEPVILFGPHQLAWGRRNIFSLTRDIVFTQSPSFGRFLWKTGEYSWLRNADFEKNLFSVAALLHGTGTTDARDFIFCIFPSLPDAEKTWITVDYTKPASDVFVQATSASISHLKTIGILGLITAGAPRRSIPNLPSWAVDFTFPNNEKHWHLSPFARGTFLDRHVSDFAVHCHRVYYDMLMAWLRYLFDFHTIRRSWTQLRPEQEAQILFDRDASGRMRLTALVFDHVAAATQIKMVDWKPTTAGAMVMNMVSSASTAKLDSLTMNAAERAVQSAIENKLNTSNPYSTIGMPLDRREEILILDQNPQADSIRQTRISAFFRAWDGKARPRNAPKVRDFNAQMMAEIFAPHLRDLTIDDDISHSIELEPESMELYGTVLFEAYVQFNPFGYVFFTTASGFVGIGPNGLRRDDLIVLPYGSRFPVALRQTDEGTWTFRGFVYVRGIMEGELWHCYEDIELAEFEFVLV